MASRPAGRGLGEVRRLFEVGAVGTLSDAQLLDRFVSGRDEVAGAAFEALVNRHGPVVLRVCRSALVDEHDAEDAFQATFLVLAHRAGSIRRGGSVSSWLFGVARRVATRARRGAGRRRALDRLVAERTREAVVPKRDDPDREALHEEIGRLPDRLREAVILRYLDGLSHDEAAARLGLSADALRGRLARARDRLRDRLARRGFADPAALLAALAGPTGSALPLSPSLVHSTIRIALGFLAGDPASGLARGVLTSMLIKQIKAATVAVCLGIGGALWGWHAFAAQDVATPPLETAPKSRPIQAPAKFELTGSVRVEGTGEPVVGAKINVLVGDDGPEHRGSNRSDQSGPDGRFAVEIPPGNARAWTLDPPVGYWAPDNVKNIEEFAVSKAEPAYRKDYVVRRGTVWDFRVRKPVERLVPTQGVVFAAGGFRGIAVESGHLRLTLPAEGGKVTAGVSDTIRSAEAVPVAIEWESGFRPEAIRTVAEEPGPPLGYRLVDEAGKSATFRGTGKGRVVPRLDGNRLVVEVVLPPAANRDSGGLRGQVVDGSGKGIEGAQVALIWVEEHGGSGMSADPRHSARTDAIGKFLLSPIDRTRPDGRPATLQLSVTKDGYAGVDTARIAFDPPADRVQDVPPVTLSPGMALSGTVVGPDGKPAAGAWIEPGGSYASRTRFARTDDEGRFTVRDLPSGMVALSFRYGKLMAGGKYLARPDAEPLTIKLAPILDPAQRQAQAEAAKAALPRPPALGTAAPDFKVVGWTDGKARSLADFRGKVVFLDFWGTWCGPCVNTIPSLGRLKAKFEPRGVVFLSIHTPGEEMDKIRRFLEFQESAEVSALDEDAGHGEGSKNGATADRYGIRGYPSFVMIDRQGKVAFHSGIDAKEGVEAMKALGKEMGLDEATMTPADFYRLWEAFFGREVEKVLDRPDR